MPNKACERLNLFCEAERKHGTKSALGETLKYEKQLPQKSGESTKNRFDKLRAGHFDWSAYSATNDKLFIAK